MSKRRKGGPRKLASGDVATNRQARFKYELLERWEAGIALEGSEVKSLRAGKANLKDAYAAVRDGQVWLHGVHIAPYGPSAGDGHDPERPRKLLLHRKEIERLIGKTQEKGLTLIPTRMYFKNGRVKVEIALAKGKQLWDKRETERRRTADREAREAMARSRKGRT